MLRSSATLAERLYRFMRSSMGPTGSLRAASGVTRVAVLLPVPYRGGTLRAFRSIAKMLRVGSRLAGEEVEVVAALPARHYDLRFEFDDLRELGITLRPFDWDVIDEGTVERALSFVSALPRQHSRHAEWLVPDDGINNLLDCDFWLMVSDRVTRPVAPLRPMGHVVYDYIQQVQPDVLLPLADDSAFVATVQQSCFVLCTTPFTAEAAVNYAGMAPERVHLVDMEIDVDLEGRAEGGQPPRTKRPFILWPTNATPHKNHLAALDAIDLYLRQHGGACDIVCTGTNTVRLDVSKPLAPEHHSPWLTAVRERIARSPVLKRRLLVLGDLEERDYFATLAGARFVFHPALVDNGTFAVTEAAWFRVPSLVHDYPAMRWMDERFGLALTYCDARNPAATARALRDMEETADARRALLPDHDSLRAHGWRARATRFWATVGPLIECAA
jgi:glycosyltransferase involved in cell wall biosynthesis